MVDVLCPVLVGRDIELSTLKEGLARALDGRGGCVFVTGESGIGKSRLVREACGLAESRGALVVVGRTVPAGVSLPYRPLTEALLQAIRVRPLPDDEQFRPWRPALGAIVPPLGTDFHAPHASSAVRGEAVVQLLGRLGRPDGLVVVFEDLHWADPDTLEVVEYLSGNLGNTPVLCIATIRSEQHGAAAMALVRRQRGRPGVTHLALDRLNAEQTIHMIKACVSDADADVVARVQREAEGLPLLVEEVLASPGVPGSFADSVRERLGSFAPGERLVIDAAAVIGRQFDWELLPAMTGQSVDVVSDSLARGVDCMLLSVENGTSFRFRHALTRESVIGVLLPPRHRALATAALAALEAAHPLLGDAWRDVAADLANRSGDRVRAGTLLTSSGRVALERGALATAIDALRQAADLLEGSDGQSDTEFSLVEALALAGRVDEAVAVGARLMSRLGYESATLTSRSEVHIRLAQAAVAASRWQLARHQLEAARKLAGTDPPPALDAAIAVLEADVAFSADDTGEARRLALAALDAHEASPEVHCHALEIIGRSERFDDLGAARAVFEQALTTAQAADLPIWRLRALHELGTIDMFDHAGIERLSEARRTADSLGALSTAAVLDLQLAAAFTCRWELQDADAHARSALAISERLGLDQIRAKAFMMLAGCHGMRPGATGELEHCVTLSLSVAPDDAMLEAFAWGCRGMLLLVEGDRPGAVDPFRRAMAVLARLPHAEPAAFRAVWPLLLASLGDRRAPSAIEEARQLGVGAFNLNRGLVGYAAAIVAGRGGHRERAESLLAVADRSFANCETWADLARLCAAEAALADGWGEPQRWLTASADGLARRGLQRLADHSQALLTTAQQNPWAALGVTPREADVFRIVADGSSNKEIAARLYLSPRTVEKHVESLLRKTGARSRTELVAVYVQPRAVGRRGALGGHC